MNAASPESFDLPELCERAGVTPRTVRYYVQQGLLPAPGMGPGTRYGRAHLDRLRLIRRLQREHLPLAEIRKRLARLDDGQVAAALRAAPYDDGARHSEGEPHEPSPGVHGAVADYVAGVLGESRGAPRGLLSRSLPARLEESPPAPYERDRWDRYRLSDDVEIHVRRPLSRETNRRVERLLAAARNILGDDP